MRPSGASTSATCRASSRVGTRTSPRGAAAGGPAAVGQPGQQGQAEGEGLARAGLRAAEHVPAGQRVGKGPGLDRERRGDALLGERRDQRAGQAELGERRRGRGGRAERGGQRAIELGGRWWYGAWRAAAAGPHETACAGWPTGRAGASAAGDRQTGRIRWAAGRWGTVNSIHDSGAAPRDQRHDSGEPGFKTLLAQTMRGLTKAHREADCSQMRPRGPLARGSGGILSRLMS